MTHDHAATVHALIQSLQAALFGREVYGPDHPAVREHTRRGIEQLSAAGPHAPVRFVILPDRVLFNNHRLPDERPDQDSLLTRLRKRGVEWIALSPGLTEPEWLDFVGQIVREADPAAPINATAHVRVGCVRVGTTDRSSPDAGAASLASPLERAWTGMYEGHPIEDDLLGIVAEISTAVADQAAAILPLAAVKSFDEYTFVHTINVSMLSAALAQAVGLPTDAVRAVTMAALLHDVGKRVIPEEVLNKKGKFTPEELAIVQRHPVEGARLLFSAGGFPDVVPIVAYEHHMLLDGTGYPPRPTGCRTHLASRIVQVADIFDALRTHRPYRAALPLDEALNIMRKDAGPKIDRALFETFESTVARKAQHTSGVPVAASPDARAAA